MQIEIVTDSTSDIPPEVAEEYHIHVVPAILNIGGMSLEDGPGISRVEFYERLPAMQPFNTDILIKVFPVDTMPFTNQPPVVPFLWGSM